MIRLIIRYSNFLNKLKPLLTFLIFLSWNTIAEASCKLGPAAFDLINSGQYHKNRIGRPQEPFEVFLEKTSKINQLADKGSFNNIDSPFVWLSIRKNERNFLGMLTDKLVDFYNSRASIYGLSKDWYLSYMDNDTTVSAKETVIQAAHISWIHQLPLPSRLTNAGTQQATIEVAKEAAFEILIPITIKYKRINDLVYYLSTLEEKIQKQHNTGLYFVATFTEIERAFNLDHPLSEYEKQKEAVLKLTKVQDGNQTVYERARRGVYSSQYLDHITGVTGIIDNFKGYCSDKTP